MSKSFDTEIIDRCRVSDDGAGSQPSSDSEPAMGGHHHHHHSSSSYRHHTHSRAAQQSTTTASQAAGQVTAAVVVHRSDKSSAASSSATGSGSISRDQAGVTLGPYDTIKPSRMRQQQKQLQQRGRSGSNGSGNNGNSVSWTLSNADPICRMGFVTHSLILFRIWMVLKNPTVQSSQQTLPLRCTCI